MWLVGGSVNVLQWQVEGALRQMVHLGEMCWFLSKIRMQMLTWMTWMWTRQYDTMSRINEMAFFNTTNPSLHPHLVDNLVQIGIAYLEYVIVVAVCMVLVYQAA